MFGQSRQVGVVLDQALTLEHLFELFPERDPTPARQVGRTLDHPSAAVNRPGDSDR
jgi:hypothetical protein